jgi:hypothetical protein
MRAFVEHRGHYGFLGFGPKYTLHLAIEFSNEERAIIQQRALQNYIFDLSPGYLATSHGYPPEILSLMMASGIAVFLAGLVFLFLSDLAAVFGPLALLALFGGVALFWSAQFARSGGQEALIKQLTVGYLLNHPNIRIQTINPAQAPTLEENVRDRIARLKLFLTDTHTLSSARTFEF